MSHTHIPAELRRFVRERAQSRCEYCLFPESVSYAPHWIDHVVAEKHGGPTEEKNLAYSCIFCNQCKGSDLTSIDQETGDVVALFHPRRDRWLDHFQIEEGKIIPRTPTGRVTERLLKFNLPDRVAERELLLAVGLFGVQDPDDPGEGK